MKWMSWAVKFWDRVEKGPDCWIWTGARSGEYGGLTKDGRRIGAHRAAWMLTFGEIPDGLNVLHKCDVKLCCNPNHLYLGTQRENTHDAIYRGQFPTGRRHGRHTKPWATRGTFQPGYDSRRGW